MPSVVWVDRFVRTSALEEHDGAVWVTWGAEPKSVDADIWERMKLSEYWAMREAAEQVSES